MVREQRPQGAAPLSLGWQSLRKPVQSPQGSRELTGVEGWGPSRAGARRGAMACEGGLGVISWAPPAGDKPRGFLSGRAQGGGFAY